MDQIEIALLRSIWGADIFDAIYIKAQSIFGPETDTHDAIMVVAIGEILKMEVR